MSFNSDIISSKDFSHYLARQKRVFFSKSERKHKESSHFLLYTKEAVSYNPSAEFFQEQWIGNFVRNRKILTPKVFSVGTIPFSNVAGMIRENVNGKSLFDLCKEKKSLKRHFILFGKTLAKLHEIATQQFGRIDISRSKKEHLPVGIHKKWEDYLQTELKEHLYFCVQKKIISKSTSEKVETILSTRKLPVIKRNVLLHGDVANHNVII